MYYSRIKKIAENKNLAIKDLAERISLSEAGLHQMIRNESIKVSILEKIAEILGVSVINFFEEELRLDVLNESAEKYNVQAKSTCANCNQLQRFIDSQTKHIERLEKELDGLREKQKVS